MSGGPLTAYISHIVIALGLRSANVALSKAEEWNGRIRKRLVLFQGLTKFNKLPSRAKLQTACEQGSLWIIEC